MPIVNARMYSVTPAVREDWRALLTWVLARARLDWSIVDYDPPAPLSALWARRDLGLVMMCGLPFARQRQIDLQLQRTPVRLVAAPLPSPDRYQGRPVYFTDLVVRADSPARNLNDTFGKVLGITLADSMSGGVAPKVFLRALCATDSGPTHRRVVGGLIHARGVIDALVTGRIDVGPLDSWYHDLLQRNDPSFAAQVRTIATTPPAPIPPLVANAALASDDFERLRAALLAVGGEPSLAPLRERLQLSGFCVPEAQVYDGLPPLADNVARYLE